MTLNSKFIFTLIICTIVCVFNSHNAYSIEPTVDYDTTRVREVTPIKKSASETLADIPGEILKLPLYTFEFLSYSFATSSPATSIFSLLQKNDQKAAYVPIVGYSARAGLKIGVGLNLLSRKNTNNRLKIKSYYSTNNYQSHIVKFNGPQLISNNIGLILRAQYKKETRQSFYGLGNSSDTDNEVNLSYENITFEARAPIGLTNSLILNLHIKSRTTNIYDGDDPNLEGRISLIRTIPSLNATSGQINPSRLINVGVELELDKRNNIARTTSGSHLKFLYERLNGVGRSKGQNYNRIVIDNKAFINIWRDRILALRASFHRIDAAKSKNDITPYYLASKLGGIETLRGYTKGRFLDNDAAHITIEYRYPIYNNVDAFLFWDEGRVFSDITKEVLFDNWRNSIGFGFRIWNTDKVLAVMQAAKSAESTRFYFTLGAAW